MLAIRDPFANFIQRPLSPTRLVCAEDVVQVAAEQLASVLQVLLGIGLGGGDGLEGFVENGSRSSHQSPNRR